jgi:hypothetical protein
LRYVDADELEDDAIDFDGMNVQSPSGEHLGNVDGFIVDSDSGRPYYAVVDAGGWFRSKHFLMPVGHLRVDGDAEALVADLDRSRVEKFPGFNRDEFEKMSVDDLRRINNDTCRACSIEGVSIVYAADEPIMAAWDRPDYRYPDWWRAAPSRPDRMGERAVTAGAQTDWNSRAVGDVPEGERVRIHDVDPSVGPPVMHNEPGRRAEVRAHRDAADPSPHLDGRAQPGDVIGVETGGERTYIGDTAEDENERRRDAEETDAKRRKD